MGSVKMADSQRQGQGKYPLPFPFISALAGKASKIANLVHHRH
jgi:hypothetical protein